MEAQLERPKPKPKVKQLRPRIAEIETVQQKIEYDWTELHHQDFESIYPSAPAGPILETINIVHESTPLLTMDINNFEIPIVSMDVNTPVPELSVQYEEIEMYNNPIEKEYAKQVERFRNNMNGPNDDFYSLLLEYQTQLQQLEESKMLLKTLIAKKKQYLHSFWSLTRTPCKVSERCPDGWTVSHTFLNEVAQFQHEMVQEYEDTTHRIKKTNYIDIPTATFHTLISRCSIQEKLNENIPAGLIRLVKILESKPTQIVDFSPFSECLDKLLEYLDTLFFVERKSVGVFTKDIRGWIVQICAVLYWSGGVVAARRVLLHTLRTPGIGTWGSTIFAWNVPSFMSDSFLNHYLVCLSAFLGPVEELEELLGQRKDEQEEIKQQMHALESDQWIVVDDDCYVPKTAPTILLSEADYMSLFPQFNCVAIFEYVVRYYTLEAMDSIGPSIQFGNMMIKTFSIAHKILFIFKRALTIIPKEFKFVRETIANCVVLFTQSLSTQMQMIPFQAKSNPIYFKSSEGQTKDTTIEIEMDKFYYRAIRTLLSSFAFGLGSFINYIKLDNLSSRALGDMLELFVGGKLFEASDSNDDEIWPLQILREPDPIYLLDFLVRLLSCDHNGKPEVDEMVIKLCFDLCLRNKDFQSIFYPKVKEILFLICRVRPINMGLVLEETRISLTAFEDVAMDFFEYIVSDSWSPTLKDVEIIENMLKDPVESAKSLLARKIIDKVSWESLVDIPSVCHKRIGFTIANIHLDIVGRAVNGSVSEKIITSAIEVTQKLSSVQLYENHQKNFSLWCWKTLVRLQMYCIPNENNTYPLSPTVGKLCRPFENIDSTLLLSLKAHSVSDSIAGYTYLMLSEISHRYDLFTSFGWDIVNLFLKQEKLVAVLEVGLTVFHTFYKTMGDELFEAPQFVNAGTQFWRILRADEMDGIRRHVEMFLELIRIHPSYSTKYAVSFLCRWIFLQPNWMKNSICLSLLDTISHSVLRLPEAHDLLLQLNAQYRLLLFQVQDTSTKQLRIRNPFLELFGLASNQISAQFPFLSRIQLYFNTKKTSGIITHTDVTISYPYYLLFALSVEVFAESDLRKEVGLQLLKENSSETLKAVKEFSIFKLAKTLLKFPLEHPVTPLMLQTFCNLYFERNQEPGPYFDSNIGCLFLNSDPDLFVELKGLLEMTAAMEHISKSNRQFFRAVYNWISNSSILNVSNAFELSPEDYPSLLQSCLDSSLLVHGVSSWWMALIQDGSSNQLPIPLFTKAEPSNTPKLDAVKSVAIVEPPEDLSSMVSTMDRAHVVLDEELAVLKGQAKYHSAYLKDHNKKDVKYLEDIKLLYHNEVVSSSTTKQCSSSCVGVTIQYKRNQATLLSSVSQNLEFIDSQIGTICSIDFVDRRTALAGMRIRNVLAFVRSRKQESRNQTLKFFYDVLELLEMKLQAFPPADLVMNEMLNEFGKLVIVGNHQETMKIFDRIMVSKNVAVLAPFFKPLEVPGQFLYFYTKVAEKLEGEDCETILKLFDVLEWSKRTDSSVEETTNFLKETIRALKIHEGDPIAFESHTIIFQNVIKSKLPEYLPHAIRIVFENVFEGQLPSTSIKKLLGSFLVYDFNEPFPEQWSFTLLTAVPYTVLLQGMSTLESLIAEFANEKPSIFYKAVCQSHDDIVIWLKAVFSASTLFSQDSIQYLEQIPFQLSSIMLAICNFRGKEREATFSDDDLEEFLSLWIYLTEKICFLFNRVDLKARYLWKIFWDILTLKNEPLTRAFIVCTETLEWNKLGLTPKEWYDLQFYWRHNYISYNTLSFLSKVMIEGDITQLGDQVAPFLFMVSQSLVNVKELKVNRVSLYQFACGDCFTSLNTNHITLAEFHDIVSSIPKKWFEKLDSLEPNPENVLSNLIIFLENILGIHSDDLEEKIKLFDDFVGDLLFQQTNDDILRDPLVKHIQAFDDAALTNIILYLCEQTEKRWKEIGLNASLPILISVFTKSSRALKHYFKIFHGFLDSIKRSQYPLLFLYHSCLGSVAPEQLALISEVCIAQHLDMEHPESWNRVHQALVLPETDESTFIRHCLSHCLVYTLYAHATSRLTKFSESLELRIMIGEQIGIWIESLNLEALQIHSGSKLILIVFLFSNLFKEELESVGFMHSRLRAHLPPIADVLNRWSEKKPSTSLWSALGFSKSNGLPSNLRLWCKYLALFIASRLQKEDPTAQKSINDRMEALFCDPEFKEWSVALNSTFKSYFQTAGIEKLKDILLELSRNVVGQDIVGVSLMY